MKTSDQTWNDLVEKMDKISMKPIEEILKSLVKNVELSIIERKKDEALFSIGVIAGLIASKGIKPTDNKDFVRVNRLFELIFECDPVKEFHIHKTLLTK